MTIEDAIRRAKALGQARVKREVAGNLAHAKPERPARDRHSGHDYPAAFAPPASLAPLPTAEISAVACERHRVLLSDRQQREFSSADAAYRLLRSRLQNRLKRNNWFSLAIASPTQGDGKSVTILNLAMSIAREKQKPVYLVDLDMRNPSICRFLGIQQIAQLPNYLAGDAKADEVLTQTSFPNLIVAGSLMPYDGASELLAGPKFGELLSHIRWRSPDACVLIDLPPVNVTDEALLVGPLVDAFIVVVSEGITERVQLAQAMGTLSEFTVAGVIVNRSSDGHIVGYEQYPYPS
jgi:Mrp family chromosome partitioning ATPase